MLDRSRESQLVDFPCSHREVSKFMTILGGIVAVIVKVDLILRRASADTCSCNLGLTLSSQFQMECVCPAASIDLRPIDVVRNESWSRETRRGDRTTPRPRIAGEGCVALRGQDQRQQQRDGSQQQRGHIEVDSPHLQ